MDHKKERQIDLLVNGGIMQYFEAIYPKMATVKYKDQDIVVIADIQGPLSYVIHPDDFNVVYRQVAGGNAADRIYQVLRGVSFEEYQQDVAPWSAQSWLSRLSFALTLWLCSTLILFGTSPERLTAVLRVVARLASSHEASLEKLAAEDPQRGSHGQT
jgi:hypothetical protein